MYFISNNVLKSLKILLLQLLAKDEARHGAAFEGLLNRYFK